MKIRANNNSQKESKVYLKFKKLEQIDHRKIDKIMKLGPMGLDLEELRVGIERKYEEMISQLNQKMERLKGYFNNVLDTIKNNFSVEMMNEKNLNLENLKKLESILESAKEEVNEDDENNEHGVVSEGQIKLLALRDFFNFVKEFKEESYSLIISELKNINLISMKKELDVFANKNLNSLYETPKSFPTQLYRFFYDNQEIYEEEVEKTYGPALAIQSSFPEEVNFKNTMDRLEPCLENYKNRAPLIKILSDRYVVVGGRNDFKIFDYGWVKNKARTSNFSKVVKSRFFKPSENESVDRLNDDKMKFEYKTIYSSIDEQIANAKNKYIQEKKKEVEKEMPAYHYLGFENNQLKPEDIKRIKEKVKPGYHCICHLKPKQSGKHFLLLGGNHNVIS